MSLTFVSGKDNGILLDIGKNMEKLDGREKLLCFLRVSQHYEVYNYFKLNNQPKCQSVSIMVYESGLWFMIMNQESGFRPFDSCENQLLSIVHDTYANFDQNPTLEMRANFLDISKDFDKVWHEGLIFKLEHIEISGNLLSLLKSFLSNRFQQVVLNG